MNRESTGLWSTGLYSIEANAATPAINPEACALPRGACQPSQALTEALTWTPMRAMTPASSRRTDQSHKAELLVED